MTRPLGRRVEFDDRSRGFPIRALLPEGLRGRSWICKVVLDQDKNDTERDKNSCVGNGWAHELAASPVVVPGVDEPFAIRIYHEAQRRDQWPGEDYDGSSVLGGAKAVQAFGYMPEYRWAGVGSTSVIDDVMLALSHHGPVVLGTNWLENMFDSAPSVLDVSGAVAGGHCYLARGLLLKPRFAKEPVVRIRNSWGRSWGVEGDAFIRVSDLERLLKDNGEACVPVRRTR
jgi:hypothetical protein